MKKIYGVLAGVLAMLAVVSFASMAADPLTINGAGATFPYPLYSKWFYEYSNANPGVRFNYQSIGSGGGIKQITAGTVNFGATDAPMTEEGMKKLPGAILHIPTALGAVVPVYNLDDVPAGLKLTSDVLAGIYLGKITRWNDPKIAELNKTVTMPNADIVVAHRSDGSGTTDIFTNYLTTVNAEWRAKVGRGPSVNWPVGIGGKGNEGVAGVVKQTPGAIGYVELAYAKQNKMKVASLQEQGGELRFPDPGGDLRRCSGYGEVDAGRFPGFAGRRPRKRIVAHLRAHLDPRLQGPDGRGQGEGHRPVPQVGDQGWPEDGGGARLRAAAEGRRGEGRPGAEADLLQGETLY